MGLFGGKRRSRNGIVVVVVAAVIVVAGLVVVLARPYGASKSTSPSSSSTVASGPAGMNMAGAQQDVVISQAAIDAKPAPWDLSTPQKAVTSCLEWTSYAYRIATSSAATATMGADQGVRIDSYIQYNLQRKRLLDQHLDSITFGTASKTATATLVPAKEKWTYSYMSISKVGKVVGGPYGASYETTYTVSKTAKGWIVMSVVAKPIGTIK